MAAMAGSRSAACLKVPLVVAVAPSERGKNSYQEPYRARGRSTQMPRRLERVASLGGFRSSSSTTVAS